MIKRTKLLSMLLALSLLMTPASVTVSASLRDTASEVSKKHTVTQIHSEHDNSGSAPSLVSTAEPAAANARISTIQVQHNRTAEEVVRTLKQFPHSGFDEYKITSYETTPVFTAPYQAGSLSEADIKDAENAVKAVRYLCGVPYENVDFTAELNNIAQHGAVLLASSNQFSHTPAKPSDMSNDFYNLGYLGCSEANISAGRSNISASVLGFMFDSGANNIERAGHRRWIMNPGNQQFGIGYAKGPNASYSGYRINMHVFAGDGPFDCAADTYIAWPSDGAFPIQYLAASSYINQTITCPWSINLGSSYGAPDRDKIVLKLTRERDGKVWIFDKNTPNLGTEGLASDKLHLSCDNSGYGILKAIIFRPDPDSLGAVLDGDVFHVNLSGITTSTGKAATLNYSINFFDLENYKVKQTATLTIKHKGVPLSGAEVTINDQTLTTDANGMISLSLNSNQSYNYSVSKAGYVTEQGTINVLEENVTKEITLNRSVTFTFTDTDKVYNGTEQTPVILADPNVAYTVTYNGAWALPKDAGTYTVTAAANENGYGGTSTTQMIIRPKEITLTDLDLDAKSAVFDGVLETDTDISLDFERLNYEILEDIDDAVSKVLITNLKLTGTDAKNYLLTTKNMETYMNTDNLPNIKIPFTDVAPERWYYDSVEYVYKNKLFSGLTDTLFGPNTPVTRGMVVTVLYRAEGNSQVTDACPFNDVRKGSYYEDAVTWAAQNGIVTGYTDTVFAPSDPILRQQIAAIFYRYAAFKGYPVDSSSATELNFLDTDDISSYAVTPCKFCVAEKIITGKTAELLKPKDQTTRAEMAAILQRFLMKMEYGN